MDLALTITRARLQQDKNLRERKISCANCDFVHYEQTERLDNRRRGLQNKKAVSLFDHNSKVAWHVHEYSHHMDFGSVKIVGHEANSQECLFLESCL